MFGVGSPSAIHSKVILWSPSTKTTSRLTLLNSGGSVKELKTNKQICTKSAIYSNMSLESPSKTTSSLLTKLNSGDLFKGNTVIIYPKVNPAKLNRSASKNMDSKIIVERVTNKSTIYGRAFLCRAGGHHPEISEKLPIQFLDLCNFTNCRLLEYVTGICDDGKHQTLLQKGQYSYEGKVSRNNSLLAHFHYFKSVL